MSNALHKNARWLARQGFPVFPVEPRRKKPLGRLVPHGAKDASTDVDIIAGWWWVSPNANIGVALPGCMVLDADRRKGGDVSLAALVERHEPLPHTWRVITADGEHYWFSLPEYAPIKSGNDRAGPGLDVKAHGGSYVLAPPSIHPSGHRYRWHPDAHPAEASLAMAPAWLVDLLTPPPPPPAKPFRMETDDDRRVADALRRIPADDREVWWRIGAALKSHFGEKGRSLWDRWSRTSEKFNEHSQDKAWRSFRGDGIGLATVFYFVKEHRRA